MAKTENTYSLRFFTYNGIYPRETIRCKENLFAYDTIENLVYTLVKLDKDDEKIRNSEMFWAYLSEVRFWSSIILSADPEAKKICLYPYENVYLYNGSNVREKTLKAEGLSDLIKEILQKKRVDLVNPHSIYIECNGYDFHSDTIDFPIQEMLYKNITKRNYLLMRGLYCLIKSNMLFSTSGVFFEEAIVTAYISLEAALIVLREDLKQEHGKKFSKEDVVNYLKESKGVEHYYIAEALYDEYGEDSYYYLRNRIIHPALDPGIDCIPDLSFEDFTEIYDVIIILYRFILLNK